MVFYLEFLVLRDLQASSRINSWDKLYGLVGETSLRLRPFETWQRCPHTSLAGWLVGRLALFALQCVRVVVSKFQIPRLSNAFPVPKSGFGCNLRIAGLGYI